MEEIKETIIDNPYGFIYITTNLINGKRYLGQKSFDHGGNWRTYLGSGRIFKDALAKYGEENFSRNIVCFCFSEEELNNTEYELSVFLNVVEDTNWYNLCYGGGAPRGFHVPEELRRKMSLDRKGTNVGADNPYFGKHHTEEIRKIISDFHKNRTKELQEKINKGHMKPVVQIDKNDIFIKLFDSAKIAQQETNIDAGHITACCKKNRKSAGGYKWVYAEEYYKTQQND